MQHDATKHYTTKSDDIVPATEGAGTAASPATGQTQHAPVRLEATKGDNQQALNATTATDILDPAAVHIHSHANLIRRAFALQNAHKADDLADLYAANSTFQDIPLQAFPKGHDAMKKLWTDTWAALSDFKMEPDFIIANGNGGAASFNMSGGHTGYFPGYPATGNRFSLKGASIIRIADGKITEWTDYWSTGDLDAQLGHK